MALTVVVPYNTQYNLAGVISPQALKYASLQGDSSYPNGGYAVSTSTFTFSQQIQGVQSLQVTTASAPWIVVWDGAYSTFRLFKTPTVTSTAMVEATSGQNLSTITVNAAVFGF